MGPGDVHAPGQSKAALMRVADETRAGGDLATAVGLYRRLHDMSPGDPAPLARLGSTLTQLKSYTQAAQAYRGALEISPNDPDLRRGLAIVLLSLGQPEPAVIQLEKAIARDHDDARLYNALGVAHDLMGRHDLAQAAYLDGLRLAPKNAGLRNNYALSLALSGDFGAAVSTLAEIAEDIGAPPRYRLNLALIYGLAGDDKKAAAIAHTSLDDASVRNNLAYYAMLRGMGDKARTSAIISGQVHGYPTERPTAEAKAEETTPAMAESKDAAPAATPDAQAVPGATPDAPSMADKDAPPPAPVPADGAVPAVANDAPQPDASGPPTKLTRPDAPDAPADAAAQPSPADAAPAPTTAGSAPEPVVPADPAASAEQEPAKPKTDVPNLVQQTAPAPPVALNRAKAKPAAATPAGKFVLQFGAFSVEANARKLADRLKHKGHDVTVVARQDAGGRQLYTVRGGSYANAAEAEAAARQIHDAEQLPTVVVRQHVPGPA